MFPPFVFCILFAIIKQIWHPCGASTRNTFSSRGLSLSGYALERQSSLGEVIPGGNLTEMSYLYNKTYSSILLFLEIHVWQPFDRIKSFWSRNLLMLQKHRGLNTSCTIWLTIYSWIGEKNKGIRLRTNMNRNINIAENENMGRIKTSHQIHV